MAEAGCSGSQEGTGWGKGGDRPKWKRVPHSLSVTHTAACQMLASNYLGCHHVAPTGIKAY